MKMEMFNELWKAKYGRDLTEKEAWGMVELIKMVMENADKSLDEVLKKQSS